MAVASAGVLERVLGGKPPAVTVPVRGPTVVRLTPVGRITAAGVAVACLAVLVVARWTVPDARGTGTHLQIGLSPCGFLERTGLPCATCGMTTSFAQFVRGNVLAAAWVQPLGAVAALGCAMAFWVAGYAAATGRPAYRVLRRLPLGWSVGLLLAFWLAAWAWKMVLVLCGRDGW